MYLTKNKKIGFTLVEILVAIAIIGILATVLLANFQGIRARARDAQRKRDLNEVRTALRLYYNDNQAYPNNNASGQINEGCSTNPCSWGSGVLEDYMEQLPNDPLSGQEYFYVRNNAGDSFDLYACLENTAGENIVTCPVAMQPTSTCGGESQCIKISAR
jgi:type II secretion system protein G